jgi:hypothetical protein
MTTTTRSDMNPGNLSQWEDDDLTAIRGIGVTREQWLRESLNVHTFRDLATLSADEIESKLKAEGRAVHRNEIEEWLAQAREWAGNDLPSPQFEESAVEADTTANSPAVEGAWKALASFVVEFQVRRVSEGREVEKRTTAHHVEADKSEEWPGIEGEQLRQWMLEQVGEKLPPEPEKEVPVEEPVRLAQVAEAQPGAGLPATVAVARLRAFQPSRTKVPSAVGEAGQPFHGCVRGNETFALEASFELAGPAAVEAASERRTYSLQFYARDLSTRASTHLGSTPPDRLVEDKLSYTAVLPEIILPPGMYRLQAVATIQSTPPVLGYLEVPLLQVV